MKRAILVLFVAATVFSSVVYAEESAPGSFAVGVHGMGDEWDTGRPTFRWRSSDKWAFDFTPVITIGDNNGHSEYSGGDSSSNAFKAKTYGLNVGAVRQVRNANGLSIGWRAEIGYVYTSVESSSELNVAFGNWQSFNERWRYIDLGFGPDLEYFIPGVPGLSIGASAQIHYQYISARHHSLTIYPGWSMAVPGANASTRENNYSLLGELLTIRYYY